MLSCNLSPYLHYILVPKNQFLAIIVFLSSQASAQLLVDDRFTPEIMVSKVLVNPDDELEIDNVRCTGAKHSIGVFSCALAHNAFIKKGLILSTGEIDDAAGPNLVTGMSGYGLELGDEQLELLAKGPTFDAISLEFDFTAGGDSVSFNFFFASEEYPEYVNKRVNDVFGFFLRDNETGRTRNLALLQPGNVPICVDKINAHKNSQYFIENRSWRSDDPPNWKKNKKLEELSRSFQFDGFTTLIRTSAPTERGKRYHIRLVLADVGDRMYDSAIFIEAGSFSSGSPQKNETNPVVRNENNSATTMKNKAVSSFTMSLDLNFDTDSFRIKGLETFAELNKAARLLRANPHLKVEITGHTDARGSESHNQRLSEQRAASAAEYLRSKGIDGSRLSHKGMGASQLLDPAGLARNRRVEFVFR